MPWRSVVRSGRRSTSRTTRKPLLMEAVAWVVQRCARRRHPATGGTRRGGLAADGTVTRESTYVRVGAVSHPQRTAAAGALVNREQNRVAARQRWSLRSPDPRKTHGGVQRRVELFPMASWLTSGETGRGTCGVAGNLAKSVASCTVGPYLLVRLRVRPEHDRVQSCAIALRSPASERSPDLKRYSPDIHSPGSRRAPNMLVVS